MPTTPLPDGLVSPCPGLLILDGLPSRRQADAVGGREEQRLPHLARHGELPLTPWDFRALAGLFEQLGPEPFAALGGILAGVCALDVVADVRLWQGRRRGAALGLAMSPLARALAGRFALRFLIAPVPIRAAFVLAGSRSQR